MIVAPISLREARRFIGQHHRHSQPPRGWLFGVSLVDDDGDVRAVGVAGRPLARALDDGRTVEITRVCTLGDRNAASRIYGALCRAAKALGYRTAVTYTLQSESGSSLRGAGFTIAAELGAREAWAYSGQSRQQVDLFGTNRHVADTAKFRWERKL